MKTRRVGLAALGAVAAAAVYAVAIEPRWLEVTRTRIHIRRLPPRMEGLRIALLSDLHASGRRSLGLARRACRLAMAEAPALVALTGDLVSRGTPDFGPVLEALGGLAAPLGVYVVPGNHDHDSGIEGWRQAVGDHVGITDLTNRSVVVEVDGARLCVTGVDDLGCGDPSLASLPDPGERDVTILLAHNPKQAEMARRSYDHVDLVLSGHTHGGQVRIPHFGPLYTPADFPDLYEAGLRRRPWTQVYTSRGVGTVRLPVRFFTRPEVAILELTSAARGPRPRAWRDR